MNRQTGAGEATVTLLCETFALSRAAYYAGKRAPAARRGGDVVPLPRRPRHTSAEVVLAAIRAVIDREPAWGVRKVWATLKRDGLKVSRKRVWALMHAHGLVLARDHEPGETPRGHVAVPEPNRRFGTDLTTTWTKRDDVIAIVPTIDCGCRTVELVVTKDQHGPAVLASVRKMLVRAFGRPENVPAVRARRAADRQRRRRARHPHAQGGGRLAARLGEPRRAARGAGGVGEAV